MAQMLLTKLIILVHSWYPPECCSGKDCRPVPCTDIVEQPNGWWEYMGNFFSPDQVKPSLDALCHVCINDTTLTSICLFIQSTT